MDMNPTVKRPYEKPAIVKREVIEVVAAVSCTKQPGNCNPGPVHT